jgi:hypothetical protein
MAVIQPCYNDHWEPNTHRHQWSKHFVPGFCVLDVLNVLPFGHQSGMSLFSPHAPPYASGNDQQRIDPGLPPTKIPSTPQ